MRSTPYLFDEFFASGKEQSISPFLTPSSRRWGKDLSLKAALLSALLLAASFAFSFTHPTFSYLLLAFVYFFAGTPAFIGAVEDLTHLEINIDVLMTFAALLSVVIGSGIEGGLLLVLFELSGAMEESVDRKTRKALISLHELSPKSALCLDAQGFTFEKATREIEIGTLILIKAGEIVPLDGIVVGGASSVNLVHLTGESHPISKKQGDEVPAGGRNLEGTLTLSVTHHSADSTLSRIIQLVTQATLAKPQLERFLDRFGKWYAMSVMGAALLFAITLPYIFSIPYLGTEGAIYRALTFLIAASPCALIIATPTAYLSALSCCAKRGIMLKGGNILDSLARCKIIAFDKTGTLTTGKLVCTHIEKIGGGSEVSLESATLLAASLEKHAVHPIAEALITLAKKQSAPLLPVENFVSHPGLGLQGTILLQGIPITAVIGHLEFILTKMGEKQRQEILSKKDLLQEQTITFLLVNQSLFAFHFTEELRPTISELFTRLRSLGLHLLMLTGDHAKSAQKIASQLGLNDYYADLRPEDKLEKVADFSQKDGLIMVGDGINDAPALARATVGISLGKIGSSTAVEASDVIFLQDNIELLDWLMHKAKKTVSIVKQNLTLALAVIFCATTPALLGIVPLWAAVILHEGGTLLVGLNSLRLLKK